MDDATSVSDAATAAADAVREGAAIATEQNAAIVAAVIDSAQDQIDAANATAEAMSRAAMETELGREISTTNRRLETCLEDVRALQSQLTEMSTQLAELRQTIVVVTPPPATSLTPPITSEPTPPLTVLDPLNLPPDPAENIPDAPAEKVKRSRRML